MTSHRLNVGIAITVLTQHMTSLLASEILSLHEISLSCVSTALRNVGRVKCRPFLNAVAIRNGH